MAVAGTLALLAPAPAFAHATFSGPATYPTGTDQRLTLDVPQERAVRTHNSGVKVFVPAGWNAQACEAPAPWQCTVSPGAEEGRDVVEWTKVAGAAPGPADETFVFTVRVGPPGKVSFPVHQTYASGEVVRWIGPAGSDKPAPTLEAGAAPATTTLAPSSTTTTPTSAPASSTTLAAPGPDPDSSGGSNRALLVVPVLVAAGLGAAVLRWRTTRP